MESGIENLLKVTGLSCDDLISKLILYKTSKNDYIPANDNLDHLISNQEVVCLDDDDEEEEDSSISKETDKLSAAPINSAVCSDSKELKQENPQSDTNDNKDFTDPEDVIEVNIIATENNEDTYKNEELKSKIIEQLNILRTKKKEDFSEVAPVTNVKEFGNKKQYSKDSLSTNGKATSQPILHEEKIDLTNDDDDEDDGSQEPFKLRDVLLNNEGNLKIVEIRSGSDVVLIDEKQDFIKPTKTSDIKKIKGWKNKRFDFGNESNNDSCGKSTERTVCDSSKEKSSFLVKPKSINSEGLRKNPFTSQDLDVFLNEVEDEIPKSSLEDEKLYEEPVEIFNEQTQQNKSSLKHHRKPRTVAEKRKAENLLIKQQKKTENHNRERNSFIYYNGSKLKISSTSPEKHIKVNEKLNEAIKKKDASTNVSNGINAAKPSIYSNTKPTKKYKPCPLSKKNLLKFSDKSKYETIVKELPPVILEVKPEFCKKIHPKVEPYIIHDTFDLNEDRVDFALSALKDGNDEKKVFEFKVPYANKQEKIKLYKRIYIMPITPQILSHENKSNVDGIIKNVVNDMLNYVQLKEVSESLIQQDDVRIIDEKYEDKKDHKEIIGNFEVLPKSQKYSRTSMELKRLNVKVIEVDIEQDADENCKKLHCQLGCICKSIRYTSHVRNHCGKVECMLECKCNYSQSAQVDCTYSKVTLPAGTNLLCNGTVNELENHAKKDLAKVEREFTQTVIQSKDKTIIVGNNLERKKRVTKAPKKLEDFIHPNNLYPEYKKLYNLNECSVKLNTHDFSHLIPFCMIHKIHNCLCIFNKNVLPKSILNKNKDQVKKQVQSKSKVKKETHVVEEKPKETKQRKPSYPPKIVETIVTNEDKEVEENNKKKRKQTFDYIRTSPILIEDNENYNKPDKEKEKQQEPALQRRKKPKRDIITNILNKGSKFFDQIRNNPEFELKNSEFYATDLLQLLKQQYNNSELFRMIPWKLFADHYRDDTMVIWYPIYNSFKILITPTATMLEKDMVDLRLMKLQHIKLDFLKWLKNNRIPPDKNPSNLYIILVSTSIDNCWEVCSMTDISRKSVLNNREGSQTNVQVTDNSNANDLNAASNENNAEATQIRRNKSRKPNKQMRYVTKHAKYSRLKLFANEDKLVDFVSLPVKKEYVKWKKIFLKSNFSIIFLRRFRLKLKYNILLYMARDAYNLKKTVILSNESISYGRYGIYAVPEYNDCVFIGPYQINDQADFETYRYANRELVSTEIFDKMSHNTKKYNNLWFYTNMTYTFKSILRNNKTSLLVTDGSSNQYTVMASDGKEIKLDGLMKAASKDVKTYNPENPENKEPRFIFFNVTDLGYVEAYVTESKKFVICWPETEPPKVFDSEAQGTQWLKMYLKRFLTSLPLTFVLDVAMTRTKPGSKEKLKFSHITDFPYIGFVGILHEIDENKKKYFISNWIITEDEYRQSESKRTEKILWADCLNIQSELSLPSDVRFGSTDDFARNLSNMIHKERSINFQAIREEANLRKQNIGLQNNLKNLTVKILQRKSDQLPTNDNLNLKRPSTDNKEIERRSKALKQLKENEDIQIETVSLSTKDKAKIINVTDDNNAEEETEIICLDSDDDSVAPVTISSTLKSPATKTTTTTSSNSVIIQGNTLLVPSNNNAKQPIVPTIKLKSLLPNNNNNSNNNNINAPVQPLLLLNTTSSYSSYPSYKIVNSPSYVTTSNTQRNNEFTVNSRTHSQSPARNNNNNNNNDDNRNLNEKKLIIKVKSSNDKQSANIYTKSLVGKFVNIKLKPSNN